MIFELTAIDECGETREFTCYLNTLESGFDLLNNVVAMGHSLVTARILDQGNQTDLPTHAFDGVSFSASLQELEREWSTILNELIAPTETTQARIGLARRQLEVYKTRIISYELSATKHTSLLERVQIMQEVNPGARNLRLIRHYEVILDQYRTQLNNAYLTRHQLLNRLGQLSAL